MAAGLVLWAAAFIAIPTDLFVEEYSFVLLDEEGRLLGATQSADEAWRFPPSGPVPEKLSEALIAFEDKRFRSHMGIDLIALARSVFLNAKRGEIVSGASTISMQIARLGLGPGPRNLGRKALEALIAQKLEILHSKDWILRLFATQAPFGGNVVGLEAAAWRYFGRSATELSWAEAATLAVLPNAPSLITLEKNRDELIAKRDALLRRLADRGKLDARTLDLALSEPLPPKPYPIPRTAFHALQALKAGRGPDAPHELRSSLDASLQARADAIVEDHLGALAANGVRNAALIVIRNADSRILAYVGNSPDPAATREGYVDLIRRPRSTGSLLKPFLYAAMFDEGLLLPEQIVADVPTQYPDFKPENASGTFRGAAPARLALAKSLNVPAVRLLRDYSVDRFETLLKSMGMRYLFREPEDYGLTLVIGGAEGTLWELAGMYSLLAREAAGIAGGCASPSLLAAGGQAMSANADRVFSRGAAYLTADILLMVQRPGTAEHWESFSSSRRIAWKTGTSQGNRDAWAIGFTPEYTVGAWAGNADGEPRPELGGTAAAGPILFAAFEALDRTEWFHEPEEDLIEVEVCARSGYRPGPACGSRTTVKAPRGARAGEPCPYCRMVTLDARGKYRVLASSEGGAELRRESWFVLPPLMEAYYRTTNADYKVLPPWRPGLEPEGERSPLAVVYPPNGSRIFVPVELGGDKGSLVAEVVHSDTRARVFWHLDESYLGTTTGMHSMGLSPSPGKHVLTLVDEYGRTAKSTFTILGQ